MVFLYILERLVNSFIRHNKFEVHMLMVLVTFILIGLSCLVGYLFDKARGESFSEPLQSKVGYEPFKTIGYLKHNKHPKCYDPKQKDFVSCDNTQNQKFSYDPVTKLIKQYNTNQCLSSFDPDTGKKVIQLTTGLCDPKEYQMKWNLIKALPLATEADIKKYGITEDTFYLQSLHDRNNIKEVRKDCINLSSTTGRVSPGDAKCDDVANRENNMFVFTNDDIKPPVNESSAIRTIKVRDNPDFCLTGYKPGILHIEGCSGDIKNELTQQWIQLPVNDKFIQLVNKETDLCLQRDPDGNVGLEQCYLNTEDTKSSIPDEQKWRNLSDIFLEDTTGADLSMTAFTTAGWITSGTRYAPRKTSRKVDRDANRSIKAEWLIRPLS